MSDQEVIERVWQAPIELIWELWTTAEGLASWYGPGGFTVEVDEIDLRAGGSFTYTMRASSPALIEAMQQRGRPLIHAVTATFTEVAAPHRLAWSAPFGPETLSTSVVFSVVPEGVRMVLTLTSTQPGRVRGPAMGWRGSLQCFAERLDAMGT